MRAFFIALLTFCCSNLHACNVPVFRYALERWKADNCDVVVFHNAPLSGEQQRFVDSLNSASVRNVGHANLKVNLQSTTGDMDDASAPLWEELSKLPGVSLPHVVVRSRVAGQTVNNWSSSLSDAMTAGLVDSPARQEVTRRLLNGHSAVWLVLKGSDEQKTDDATALLNRELSRLSDTTPIPEGIGLPGSELFSSVPLLMKFSVLELDSSDRREAFLVRTLTGFAPDAVQKGEPLIVPVFGRGRALEVLPGSAVDESLIGDLTAFLCGACSCQVKERNPGFELLMAADWDGELFGQDAADVTAEIAATEPAGNRQDQPPVLVEIPGGSRTQPQQPLAADDVAVAVASCRAPPRSFGSTAQPAVGGMILLLVIVMIAIVGGRWLTAR